MDKKFNEQIRKDMNGRYLNPRDVATLARKYYKLGMESEKEVDRMRKRQSLTASIVAALGALLMYFIAPEILLGVIVTALCGYVAIELCVLCRAIPVCKSLVKKVKSFFNEVIKSLVQSYERMMNMFIQ